MSPLGLPIECGARRGRTLADADATASWSGSRSDSDAALPAAMVPSRHRDSGVLRSVATRIARDHSSTADDAYALLYGILRFAAGHSKRSCARSAR